MKICAKEKVSQGFVKGNLYQTKSNEYIFMYTGDNKGVCLNTGYDRAEMTILSFWEDVTDKYCLKEI